MDPLGGKIPLHVHIYDYEFLGDYADPHWNRDENFKFVRSATDIYLASGSRFRVHHFPI